MKIHRVSRSHCDGRSNTQSASLLGSKLSGLAIMSQTPLLTLLENKLRPLSEDLDLVAGDYLRRGHQAIERILKLARQCVLKVGSSIFGIAAVVEQHGFRPGGELHLERSGGVHLERSAGPGKIGRAH